MKVMLLHDGDDGLNPAQRSERMIEEYHAKKPFTAIISFGIIIAALIIVGAICSGVAYAVISFGKLIIK